MSNTNTIRLHRVLRATPERVYRAFLDPDAMAKWLPPNGFTGKVHHLDAKVGGTYRMSFTNFTTGTSHSFGGKYLDRLLYAVFEYLKLRPGQPGNVFPGRIPDRGVQNDDGAVDPYLLVLALRTNAGRQCGKEARQTK